MERFKIKTKKDWCLAFIFATLVVYGISRTFSYTLQNWLLQYGNPMMTNMNQPKSYGNVMFTIVVMTIIVEIVLFRHKKSKKIMCLLAASGCVFTAAVFGMYLLNVEKIVSVIEEEDCLNVNIGYWAGNDLNLTEEQKENIARMCEELEPVSAEEEAKLEAEFYADGEWTSKAVLIWVTYPEKYGHNFDLMVCVYEDHVFIRKGYGNDQKEIVTFFEDNGLIEALGNY